ncbi:MAG: TonB-dependent receptor [Pseudomonadota bacterium]|jgi:Outer membrane receptor proteins, mostly Fe transport
MRIRGKTFRRTSWWSASTILAFTAAQGIPQAIAQDLGEERKRTIDEIIVTAQKREQNLQDVPITVTALSGQLLQDTGVRDIKDLTLLTPGLIVTSTSNETVTTARIRGIGTVGDNPGLESSVGIVIDGVYRPRNGVSFGDLGEIERIEVLKGPQGTLFGKNTSAGVINIISRQPEFNFGASVELGVGNFGSLEGSASITGPIARDKVAGRLYVATRERDGFYDVVTGKGPRTVTEDYDRSFYTVRGQLLFTPSENVSVRLIGDYTDRDENCCAAVQTNVGASGAIIDALTPDDPGVARPAAPFDWVAYSNRPTDQNIEDMGLSAEVNWDIGDMTFTSITAWRNWETVNGQDSDFSTADILWRPTNGDFGNEFDIFSQELRLAGQTGRINWLVGGFFAREELRNNLALLYGSDMEAYYSLAVSGLLQAMGLIEQPNPAFVAQMTQRPFGTSYVVGEGARDVFEQDSKSWALFTNNTIAFTDALELTIGLRYTKEEKTLDSVYQNVGSNGEACAASRARLAQIAAQIPNVTIPGTTLNPFATYYGLGCATFADPLFNNLVTHQELDESEWSGTAKLAYRFTDDVMAYVSYARGYKAGGFNLDRERTNNNLPNSPLAPPIQADLDTSFPSELVDSYELGVKTQWGTSLLLNGALFYQDYQDFQLNTFTGIQFVVTSLPQVVSKGVDIDWVWFAPNTRLTLQGGITYADTKIEEYGAALAFFHPQRKGDRLSFAPEWSGSLALTYEQPIAGRYLWRTNIGAKLTSDYNTGSNLDPGKAQDSVTLVNARLGFGADDGSWMVEAWAQNLTNEEYYQVVFDATLQTGVLNAFLGAPRTYGLTLRMNF